MSSIEMVLSYLIAIGIGALGGYFLTNARHRRDGDGKTVKEWRAEYGDYKQSVNEHFQRSAELFQGLTEQYRQVYSHLAEGAVTLCRESSDDPRIEALRTGLLTGGVAAAAASDAAADTETVPAADADTAALTDAAADVEELSDEASGDDAGDEVTPAAMTDSADTPAMDAAADEETAPPEQTGVDLEVPAFTSLAPDHETGGTAGTGEDELQQAEDGDAAPPATRTAA